MDFWYLIVMFVLMFVIFPLGIVWVANARYTKAVKAKFLEGLCNQARTECKCTKASYVVDGTTYIWNAQPSDIVDVSPNAVVGQTEIDLYCDPKNPSAAQPGRDSTFGWGIAFIVIGSIMWLIFGGATIYEKWTDMKKKDAETA